MLSSFGTSLGCFEQSTVGFLQWSIFGVGVFGGPLSSPGLSWSDRSPCLVLDLASAFGVLREDLQ